MSVFVFAKDMVSFPAAWVAGSEYKEVKEKARDFLYSTARVVIACSLVWGIFQAQHCEAFRKLTVPVVLLTGHAGGILVSLEPISLMINLYLIKTAKSSWITGGYCVAGYVWQCIVQTIGQWTKEPPAVFFSATVQQARIQIALMTALGNIAVWKVPETRFGIGIFLTLHGIFQLHAYTADRWNLFDVPTEFALKGIWHVACGLCWIGAYEHDNRQLEKGAKKNTYLYRAAEWAAPSLAWLVTGQTK